MTRLAHGLNLQRFRLTIGEVAGTDVTQMELAWAGAMSTVQRQEAEREGTLEALRQLCGGRCVPPKRGDLDELTRLTSTPRIGEDRSAFLEMSPLWRSRALRAAFKREDARVLESTAWGRPEAEIEWEHVPALEGLRSYDAFGVRVRFPLPAGSAASKTREAAKARMVEADAIRRLGRARLLTRLESALAAARASEQTLSKLEPVLQKVERAEHSLAEQFRLGAISYLVYMDGVSRFDDVQLQAIEARRTLLEARLDLAVLGSDSHAFPIPEPPQPPDSQNKENQQ